MRDTAVCLQNKVESNENYKSSMDMVLAESRRGVRKP